MKKLKNWKCNIIEIYRRQTIRQLIKLYRIIKILLYIIKECLLEDTRENHEE